MNILKRTPTDGTVNDTLSSRVGTIVPANKVPIDGIFSVDLTIDNDIGLWCRIFVPTVANKEKKLPVIVYYHGGGFVLYGPDSEEFDTFGRYLSKTCEAVVVCCNYRKAPEHKYPKQHEDGFMSLEWLRSQSSKPDMDFPIDVVDFSRVFLSGDSAGGNIAHHVAAKVGSSNMSPLAIEGMILIQPFFGSEERTSSECRLGESEMLTCALADWFWCAFLPPGSNKDHEAVNVCGPSAPTFISLNLPRTMVVVGGKDILQDTEIQYVKAMQAAGKECKLIFYETAFHGFYSIPSLKSTLQLGIDFKEFILGSTVE